MPAGGWPLSTGPGVYICDGCTGLAVVSAGTAGKPIACICSECLELCGEIITEELGPPA